MRRFQTISEFSHNLGQKRTYDACHRVATAGSFNRCLQLRSRRGVLRVSAYLKVPAGNALGEHSVIPEIHGSQLSVTFIPAGPRRRPSPTRLAIAARRPLPTSRPCHRPRRSGGALKGSEPRPHRAGHAGGLDGPAPARDVAPLRAAGKARRSPRWSWGRCLA